MTLIEHLVPQAGRLKILICEGSKNIKVRDSKNIHYENFEL